MEPEKTEKPTKPKVTKKYKLEKEIEPEKAPFKPLKEYLDPE